MPPSSTRLRSGVVALSALLGLAAPAAVRAAPYTLGPPGQMVAAEKCGTCHRDIYQYWKSSLHAQAADDWRYQDVFNRLKEEGTPGVDALCPRCHAPAAVEMRDTRWEKKVSWEGVTCDFCHSVRGVRPDPERPFILEPGAVKTGPLKDVVATGHEARYAEVFVSSALCAPCHQFVNAKRLELLSTYAEWQASSYAAKGITCQSCHMRKASGNIVDPKVARVANVPVNLHEMPGGHSLSELNRALQAQISAERRGDNVDVTVQVLNRGAGHRVPTGSPLRAITMVVDVDTGTGRRQTATRSYARVVADENGQEIVDEGATWLRAARVLRDDRFVPDERRVEKFSFQAPRNAPVRAVAKFFYRYAPQPSGKVDPGAQFLLVSTWLDAEQR
jgi:hypothetical protein